MLTRIYSRVDMNRLLHVLSRPSREPGGFARVQILPESEFLQASWIRMPEGKSFLPHAHVLHEATKTQVIAQESWVVVQGAVKCFFYDLDDMLLQTPVLKPGDASFSLGGGHTYMALSDDTIVYEFKTGPYLGPDLDKRVFGDAPPR